MKVLLAYKANEEGATDPFTSLLPIGLGYINAFLRSNGRDCRIANLSSFSWQQTASLLRSEFPQVVGISQFTHNRHESLKLAVMAKEINPACFVVLGGPHATLRYKEVMAGNPAVDAVVLGEGEETILDLLDCLARGEDSALDQVRGIAYRVGRDIAISLPRPPIEGLDSLPFPASGIGNALGVDPRRQLEFIITSRGCPAACRFCSSPRFWGKATRFRSPRSIVDEIRYIRDHYGLIYFSIRDDTFTADRERVLEFCRLLIDEKVYILWNCQSRVNALDSEILAAMRRAGCECVQLGVESGSSRVLRELGKGITPEQSIRASRAIRDCGINLSVYLISGVPGEAATDLQATIDLVEEIRPHDGQVSPLVYYPGTQLFAEGVAMGAVGADLFERDSRVALPVEEDQPTARSTRKLLKILDKAADRGCFTKADVRAHRKRLGYCHATNILAGELYEEAGDWRLAEKEYREITVREPENPWGWFYLGNVQAVTGEHGGAIDSFRKMTTIVPAHVPAYQALSELYRLVGDRKNSRELNRQALMLQSVEEKVDPTGKAGRR